jgi:hypothetical protein
MAPAEAAEQFRIVQQSKVIGLEEEIAPPEESPALSAVKEQ